MRPSERAFIEALVALAPHVLNPVLTQLDGAHTCDDAGWLVVRGSPGEPCRWPAGYPFDVKPAVGIGPQGCFCMILWFDDDGQLQAVEFLMLENEPLQLNALTAWLVGGALFATSS